MTKMLYWSRETVEVATTKRFWLFLNADYEASGGMLDFKDSFDTLDEAINRVVRLNEESQYSVEEGHIFDSLTRKIVAQVSDNPNDFGE